MALKPFRCSSCGEGPMQLFAHVGDDIVAIWDVQLVCNTGRENQGCGNGDFVIDSGQSPVDCVKDLVTLYFPQKGEPLRVEKDEKEPDIISFNYRNTNYGDCKTIFSCSIPDSNDSNWRVTWYWVKFEKGEALLQHRQNIIESEPDIWLLADISMDAVIPPPLSPGHILVSQESGSVKYAVMAYRILYEIENLLRRIIITVFPNNKIEEVLKNTACGSKDKNESVFDRVSQRKKQEQSIFLSQKNVSLIEYIDWQEYIEIFRQNKDDFFSGFPNRQEAMKRFISKLEETQSVRHKIAHMRSGVRLQRKWQFLRG